MGIKFPEKTYFTFHELLVRWQCTPADLHRLIISATLKPSIRADIGELSGVTWVDDPFNGMEASEWIEDYPDIGKRGYSLPTPTRACWVHLQRPHQTASFDCRFTLAADEFSPDWPTEEHPFTFAIWYRLPKAVGIKEIEDHAVFLLEEVARFESAHGDETQNREVTLERTELKKREKDTLLTIIAALAKHAKIDVKEAGKSAQYISGLTEELGASVSKRTIEDHLKKIPDALEVRMK